MPETPKKRTITITDNGTDLEISADGMGLVEAIGIFELAKHDILNFIHTKHPFKLVAKRKTILPDQRA